jgi:hypothetical protein
MKATAAAVVQGRDADLSEGEATLVSWSRQVAHDPNATAETDVDRLRQAAPQRSGDLRSDPGSRSR